MSKKKIRWLAGIDEAGRGPLAGPITVAAVVATSSPKILKNIRDSKKLTPKKREQWFEVLKNNFEYRTASVGPKTIDKIGIQKATHLAVARALRKIKESPTSCAEVGLSARKSDFLVLLDGRLKAPKRYNQKSIIKGDEKIPIISAASIIAKVIRDRKMVRFHKKHPQYNFDRHKGYATKHHYKMLKTHGICQIHRKTFRLA